jgi:hypothetical protein
MYPASTWSLLTGETVPMPTLPLEVAKNALPEAVRVVKAPLFGVVVPTPAGIAQLNPFKKAEFKFAT